MPTNRSPSKIFANVAIVNPPYRHGQQGMALLTILLLVVAITIVAGSMLANQKVMIREFELTKGQGQLKEYALAGEAMATNLIAQDSQVNQVDSLADAWAKPIAEQTINQARVNIKIDDDASRFNVNNLYHDGKVDDTALAFFKRCYKPMAYRPTLRWRCSIGKIQTVTPVPMVAQKQRIIKVRAKKWRWVSLISLYLNQ